MAMLTLRIDDELNNRITALAQKTGRTKTYFIKKLLVEAIDDLEDELWAQEAVREYRASVARGEKQEWVDHDTLMKELDARDLALELLKSRKEEPDENAKEHQKSGTGKS
ncbi:MAG: hypothetical protein EB036_12205 [Betaproteobacteria bacterium]|nr:hypothetical protein [Betaproteobacteria bacterium]